MARAVLRRSNDLLRPLAAASFAATISCHAKQHWVNCSDSPSDKTWAGFLVNRLRRERPKELSKFARVELGWEKNRTDRARALVGDEELRHIATLINKLVDLDSWDEDQEQELFEHAVSKCIEEVCGVLPPPFWDLLHTRYGCLEEGTLELLSKHLVDQCKENCYFPYLDVQDKRRIIRAVVWCVLEGMKEGKDLETFAAGLETDSKAEDIIVEVFIQGAMDVFFDDEMRKDLVMDVTSYIDDVPFVPHALIEKIADRIMIAFSGVLQDALNEAFITFKAACMKGQKLPVLPDVLGEESGESARVLEIWKGHPFVVQLRRIFINNMLEKQEKALGATGFIIHLIPQKFQAWVGGRVVDLIFEQVEGLQKIEDTIQPFHAQCHDHSHKQDDHVEGSEVAAFQVKMQSNKDEKIEDEAEKKHEIIAKLELQAERWPECFISLDQPFGFADTAAADYVEIATVSPPPTPPIAPTPPLTPHAPPCTDIVPLNSKLFGMRCASCNGSLSPVAQTQEAKLLHQLKAISCNDNFTPVVQSQEANLLHKLKELRHVSYSSPGDNLHDADAHQGQLQRVAALKVAIMGLETYLSSYASNSSSPCPMPPGTQKWAGA